MESLAAIECDEEGLEMEIVGWLAINEYNNYDDIYIV